MSAHPPPNPTPPDPDAARPHGGASERPAISNHPGKPALDGAALDALAAKLAAAEGELAQLRAGLEHSQRLATLGTLAALIAHEFNNILTPVQSYAQMALSAPGDVALTRKALERAEAGASRAAQVSAAILNLARDEFADLAVVGSSGGGGGTGSGAQAGSAARARLAARGEAFHVAPVREAVEAALSCLARDLGKERIELELAVGDERAAIRPVALQQVLLNLILNARKSMLSKMAAESARGQGAGGSASGGMGAFGGRLRIEASWSETRPTVAPGGYSTAAMVGRVGAVGVGSIECSTWNIDRSGRARGAEGGWLVVRIRDTGVGISERELGRVFEPYVTSGGGGGGGGGIGLGLVVSRRLVEDAGGELWVESTAGAGATFSVVVPGSRGVGVGGAQGENASKATDAGRGDDAGQMAA
jgi:signal transduction histidine kinase